MKKVFLGMIGLLLFALPACGTIGNGAQGYAGLDYIKIDYENGEAKQATMVRGKEESSVKIAADLKSGSLIYEAEGVKAFEGQAVRSEVEKALYSELGDVAPDIIARITETIMKGLSP